MNKKRLYHVHGGRHARGDRHDVLRDHDLFPNHRNAQIRRLDLKKMYINNGTIFWGPVLIIVPLKGLKTIIIADHKL